MTYYTLSPLHPAFGAVVDGIDLSGAVDVPRAAVDGIKRDLLSYRFLLFRDQVNLTVEDQLTISRWFGDIQSTFGGHPKSPSEDIFRVSNDPMEGRTKAGTEGWHIDGIFLKSPFKTVTMHFPSVSKGGKTMFVPLHEVVEKLSPEDSARWSDLHFVTTNGKIHPFVYPHPFTGLRTMAFHCGPTFAHGFLRGYREATHAVAGSITGDEANGIIDDLKARLEDPELLLAMDWRAGDFAIFDNLAVAHYPHPDTQKPREEVGLRVMHRTTVANNYNDFSLFAGYPCSHF